MLRGPSLSEVFGFTEAQLSSNREGVVADGQTTSLWISVAWGVPLGLGALLVGLAAIKYARGVLRVLGPLMGGLAATFLGVLLVYTAVRDLVDSRVVRVEGPVTEQVGVGKGPGKAVLTIGGERLSTEGDTMAAAAAIEKGVVYRAYYLPHTKRLLSIEPVGMPPP
jgi:hypothetical protein